jgi:hypothetical protein
MFVLRKNEIFSLAVLLSVIVFFIFSCKVKNSQTLKTEQQISDTESQDSKKEQSKYSIIGSWILEENDGSPYIFTFTDKECTTLFLGNDKTRTAKYEINGDKIFSTIDGMRHEWDYEFQDEDTLKINIETSQRYFIGKKVKDNITTLNGVYNIVNGVGFIFSFEFIDSSNVNIIWAGIHGDFITDTGTYEIHGTSVILSSEVIQRNLEIVGDTILLITGMPNGSIAVFLKILENSL